MEDEEAFNDSKLPELKLDARQAQGFIAFYRKLPSSDNVIRFFDRKDYFTAHGDDAVFIAKTYYRTTSAIRQLGSTNDALSSVSISKSMLESILRDLLLERTDHVVELYEGSGSNWRLVKSGSPGKLGCFEDILFANNDMQDSPTIMAVQYANQDTGTLVGMSFIDLTRRTIGMVTFLDDSQYTNLESAMVALGCKECLLPQSSGKSTSEKRLLDVLSRCNVMLTERKRTEFKSRDLDRDLQRLVKGSVCVESLRDLVASSENAAGALGALLSYTDLLADTSNYGKFTIQPYNQQNYMRLDSAALRALNVLESTTDANKNFSLFGLMNRTCTAGMGKRLLNRWLKQPLLDVDEIKCRLDVVQAFVEDAAVRQDLRQLLKRVTDVERLSQKLEKRKATLQDIVKLYQTTIRLPLIKSSLEKYEGPFSSFFCEKYVESIDLWTDEDHLGRFAALVETAIDLEQLDNGEYMIAAGYHPSLVALKDEHKVVEDQIQKVHQQAANDLDLPADKALKLERGSQFGHVFRITKKEEPKVRKKLNTQYIVLETRKDGVKFTNPRLKRLGEQYTKLVDDYAKAQREIVARVVDTAATFTEVFEEVSKLLSELDVLLSFADLATSCPTPYVRPEITASDHGDIILQGSRHPCVEAQDGVNFIPNDCHLVRSKSWFQIITGPNMGGKSTFIRQVGVNVLMAQVGCFVPCDHATISVRDAIFARVGAGDCQLRGVSTFMSEMLESASIIKGATDKALIIIDELGRGTSTYDGFGLAWAICEYLTQVTRAPTLFATHFHELTALAYSEPQPVHGPSKDPPVGIANYHVSAHIDTQTQKLTMLYKVEEGPCDQSFGIHVAEFAQFPEEVVALARAKASELEDFTSASDGNDQQGEEVGVKRKRVCGLDDVARGTVSAKQFLDDFVSLPLDQMDFEQALQHVNNLKSRLERVAADNKWLQQFF
eukprot:TRINITY_DN8428_c0_g1_i1.p1 TRINITY_DN8428_c0_g1~~TRINITY_DN8428_c0_g1_i1.p1  ORF type:complete len:948 (+),score=194.75 TRINITY_DN8428_c0_g1_i1:276-3119(+)